MKYYHLIDHFDNQGKAVISKVYISTDGYEIIGFEEDKSGFIVPVYNSEVHYVVFRLENGDYIGDTYETEEEVKSVKEEDFFDDVLFQGVFRGYQWGEEQSEKVLFLRQLAKNGIQNLISLGFARSKKKVRRPSFRKGMVEETWERNKKSDGRVYDPDTGEEIIWDRSKKRRGQWDMGHKPGREWWRQVLDFLREKKNRKDLIEDYNDPDNFQPELPSSNRRKKNEQRQAVIFCNFR